MFVIDLGVQLVSCCDITLLFFDVFRGCLVRSICLCRIEGHLVFSSQQVESFKRGKEFFSCKAFLVFFIRLSSFPLEVIRSCNSKSIALTNKLSGSKIRSLLSLSSFGQRSGRRDRASDWTICFPGT